jgi:rare lipoprotein A
VTPAARCGAAVALAIWLAACASAPRRPALPSRPPPAPPAPSAPVPDAVPRAEPRSRNGNPPFYDVNGERYRVLSSAAGYVERGVASWYGPDFQGHSTSSGERYDMYAMTAAHRTLPIPCYARITNLANGRSILVRINDRGPFVANRIVDLSYSAAERLDIVRTGTAFVELRTVGVDGADTAGTEPSPVPAAVPAATAATAATPTAAPESPQQPAAAAIALYIQVGAFADQENARRLIERLEAHGLPHVFSLATTGSGRLLHRVRVGPIATVEQFDALAARLAAIGYPEARLAND